jgi:hypothetical protein
MTVVRSVRSTLALGVDRLDAGFHTSPGEAAAARLIASDRAISRLGDHGAVWTPSRFARVWAAPGEPWVPYLRPYDTFDYLPVAADRLSAVRTSNLDALRLTEGDVLITVSGRNLGPVAYVGATLASFALSHDMARLRVEGEEESRYFLYAYLRSPTGQALLRRGKAGSVVDHITVEDVQRVPVPAVEPDERTVVAGLVAQALSLRERARANLIEVAGDPDAGAGRVDARAIWEMPSTALGDRLDAARYHPAVVAAAAAAARSDGPLIGDMARAVLPVRYRRFYVEPAHGRPIVSGRQLLQADTVNLRYVSDRSFRDPAEYELQEGATIFGAVGRSEGRVGQPALIAADRARWLASNDVMRLFPHDAVRPGALWAAVASAECQSQIKSLSFGSVIDHMNPWDVEALQVAPVDPDTADVVEDAWRSFADAAGLLDSASEAIEALIGS